MRLILDTHILLWALTDEEKLPSKAQELLLDPDNHLFVSTASLWEIAIKRKLLRGAPGDMPVSAERAARLSEQSGLELLPVLASHAIAVEHLPTNRHADPFDRLLAAQAISEPMYLLTRDGHLAEYGEHVILV